MPKIFASGSLISKRSGKNSRKLVTLVPLLLLFQLVLSPFASVSAATIPPPMEKISGEPYMVPTLLDPNPNPIPTHIPPPANFSVIRPATATITVNYTGFGAFPQAQAAFQRAVDIWSSQISSPVPIVVNASWTSLTPCGPGGCVLGSAGPQIFLRNFTNAPQANTYYPIGLANKLAGTDLDPTIGDITAYFNKDYTSWYFGTDGNPPNNQIDFISIVLHELGHGLGFIGTMKYTSGSGSYGFGGIPSIYDHFAVNGSPQSLINTALFPNPSVALGNQLVSGNLFFDSPTTRSVNGGNPAKLYAPGTWAQGSSFSHLDNIYAGTPNALMTYSISTGQVKQNPGPIMLAMFQDMGWTVALLPPAPTNLIATSVTSTQVSMSWNDNSTNESGFRIERSTVGAAGPFVPLALLGANATATVSYTDTGLTPFTAYYYRVLAYSASGDSAYSNVLSSGTLNAIPNPPSNLRAFATSDTQITVYWSDNSHNETGFKLERSPDSGANWTPLPTTAANVTTYNDTGLTNTNTYYYRVRSTNAIGDSGYSNIGYATTGTPNLVVTSNLDDGTGAANTLSKAINDANALNGYRTITFGAVTGNLVTVSGTGLPIPRTGVSISGGCSLSGPTITIEGGGTPALTLNRDSSLFGLKFMHFAGPQLSIPFPPTGPGNPNLFMCVVFSKV